jgi:HAE1 family hydrophobic/amphiphilic exporter-1
MSLADLSIRRPTFITCIVLLMLAVGFLCMERLGVDLFPNVTFPVVMVQTPYPGAGPSEVETLVSKPLEEEISTVSGIKRLSSTNQEGVSVVVAEFTLETDVKYAEQQIRDRVSSAKSKLPDDIEEPVIRRIDPADQPILVLALKADLSDGQLYDLADQVIKPKLEQVNQVGLVEILGGRKREIQVQLDRRKLKEYELSATQVASRLQSAGENIPAGKVDQAGKETVFRTMGEFTSLADIQSTVVNFFGNDVPTTIADLGKVKDTLEDEKSRTYLNGDKSLFIYAFRQSGANTIAVVDGLKSKIDQINKQLKSDPSHPEIRIVRDGSMWIHANVDDVKESILFGVGLAVLVVFLFLANGRSTIITGLALPNSLIGAFILMTLAGFTINVMTLLALSLSVGLLIDDAIVVRENIFRHIEMGKDSKTAAREGTAEVRLAVIATTLTVIAVFGPVGFLKGVVGQFFREFGLTICFAMAISLFDALTIAPMLSAYFAGASHEIKTTGLYGLTVGRALQGFDRFQGWLENRYERLIRFTLRKPKTVLSISFLVFLGSCSTMKYVPKTFLPAQDAGEFSVGLDLPPGTSLQKMSEVAEQVDQVIRKNPEVEITALTIGDRDGSSNVAEEYVHLVPSKDRKINTIQMKDRIREQLARFASANPKVKDFDPVGAGMRPFNLNLVGADQKQLEAFSNQVLAWLRKDKRLKDVDINYRPGKPEFQVALDKSRAQSLGVSSAIVGSELRAQIEGVTPAKFRQNGYEYDVRVRLEDEQRDLKQGFDKTYVPNINMTLVRLPDIAKGIQAEGPAKITRMDRGRYIQVNADITPGAGMGDVMADIEKNFASGELKLPPGIHYSFVGQAEDFKELGENMALAMGFGVLFIFLVLASLYESFVTPFTIMLALPLAICGCFVALAISGQSLNIFSWIGAIMLLGVATKNSILLVDYANQLMQQGLSRADALIRAGRTRLRPILMTTMALIAGTLPVALGLNEASRQRTSMGVAIIGGLISSTLLTLIVVPAAFGYIDRFRLWSRGIMGRIFLSRSRHGIAQPSSDKSSSAPGMPVGTS